MTALKLTHQKMKVPHPVISFLLLPCLIHSAAGAPRPEQIIRDPFGKNTNMLAQLEAGRTRQLEAAKSYQVDYNFQFVDRRPESGITFMQRVVDDASKNWVAAHYDHGTGVAVADVDGDGHLDLYFANQVGANELWRNLGNGKFENITQSAGVALADQNSVGAAFSDLDNDGRPDLLVTNVRTGNRLFKNVGNGRFEDVTTAAGLGHVGHSSGIVVFDYDRDGLLDLFVCNVGAYTTDEKGPEGAYRAMTNAFHGHLFADRAELSFLYHNEGGLRFKEVSAAMGLQDRSWSGDASFTDINLDGYPDLYVLSMQGDDQFYLNEGGRRFVEATARYFPKTPWGAMGIKFFDFDGDGRLDLYLTDMHSDMTEGQTSAGLGDLSPTFEKRKSDPWCTMEWGDAFLINPANNIFGNALYRNTGEGVFAEVSDAKGAETYWPWGFSTGDFNGDGFEDLFVTGGMGHPFRYGINSLLLNEGGLRFVDAEFLTGVEPRRDNAVEGPWFTLEANGEDRGNPLVRRRNGKWTVYGSLTSRSSAAVDLDGDGDLDLVSNEQQGQPLVLINDRANRPGFAWLQVKLEGTRSNREGIGALVKLHAAGRTQTRQLDGKSGYLAVSSVPLHFGLGKAGKVDRVEITWPSGRQQVVTEGLDVNRTITIKEPAE